MVITLDSGVRSPLHDQITAAIREQVASGVLPAGSALPASATLARSLGVNRNTVLRAYRRLADEGVVDLRRSRGAIVRPQPDLTDVLELSDRLLDAAADAGLTLGSLLALISRRASTRAQPTRNNPR